MNEISKFDFSKIEDQKRFDASPEDIKKNVIENSQEEAEAIQKLIESGQALNYQEAEKKLENIYNKLERCLIGGSFLEVEKIISSNILPKEKLKTPEIQEVAHEALEKLLRNQPYDFIENSKKLIDLNLIPREKLETPEIQAVVYQGLIYLLSGGHFEDSINLIDLNLLPEDKVQEAVYKALKILLRNQFIEGSKKIIDLNLLPKEKIETPEIQAVAYEVSKDLLLGGRIGSIKYLIDLNLLPREKLETLEIQAVTYESLKNLLSGCDIIKSGYYTDLNLSPEDKIKEVTYKSFKDLLSTKVNISKDHIARIKYLIDLNLLPKEKLETPEIQEEIYEGLKEILLFGNAEYSKEFIDLNLLSKDKIQEAARESFVYLLSKNQLIHLEALIHLNLLPKEKLETPEIQEAAYGSLKYFLSTNILIDLRKLIDLGLLPKEKLETSEIREIFKQEIALRIGNGKDDTESIKELLSFIGMQELIELFPELRIKSENVFKSLERIDRIDPVGVQKLKMNFNRSFSLQLFFYQNSEGQITEMVIKNPFLLDALIGNEQFGSRLVSAYGGFDRISKSKIGSIFQFKEEILKENPQIKKDSPEFRFKMQEKLREFMDNPKILAEMEKQGIDVAKWLDYDVKDDFVLGGEEIENISINRLIERPFNRIMGETIPEYVRILEEELAPYQKDLQGIYISNPQIEEIDIKIATMQKALAETGDEKNKNGILKGIRSLEAKREKLKPISLGEKIKGSIFGINSLMEIVRNKKAEIAINEEEKNFKKINELKKKIFEDYKTLCVRFENFQSELHSYLTEYFKEHGDAIIQSIDQQTAEMLSHFTTDNEDIRKVFEDVDFEENIKKMKNVSLELWNRNPDIDLYLGNYSPCCISIEGGAGWNATESAIADYMTDISVQVLNLVDKERKIPIMSAWLYVGEDQNNKTALVIDNIESDASQTDLYQKEIWKRIEEYIIAYAKEIGVDKIVMGASNNDIEPIKVNRDNNKYKKIGPISVNGRSTGYYLESEYVSDDYEEYVDEGGEEYEEYEEDEENEVESRNLYLIWKK